jgi:Na+/H+ antiporter NhaD/arsenite permease-like protein
VAVILLLLPALAFAGGGGGGGGYLPHVAWVTPFALMLLCIAVLPLVAEHVWEPNRNKLIVSLVLGTPILVLFATNDPVVLMHTGEEYVSFILLLAALYVISGGILLTGDLRATPLNNVGILALGSLLASFMGTTGAAMLLIRPILKSNEDRKYKRHTVIFFIFLVCNIGGCLTPLGDPPLFLGYLKGVPFSWTFSLWPQWLAVCLVVLLVYFIWDSILFGKEPGERMVLDRMHREPMRVHGLALNAPLLGGVIASVAFLHHQFFLFDRELAMVLLAAASMRLTPKPIRQGNHFNFHPINEVACLFFGIFLTMMPAIQLLNLRGDELGVTSPTQFFWYTGVLSSFLDNAPTYVTFLSLGDNVSHSVAPYMNETSEFIPLVVEPLKGVHPRILTSISLGAVFMGANSYIGNAPNFMVKSIAESRDVPMPSFGGYLLWSTAVLVPIFIGVTYFFIV